MGIAIDNGEILYGEVPRTKLKLVHAWIEIHKKELMDDWQLAVNGQKPFKIDPLNKETKVEEDMVRGLEPYPANVVAISKLQVKSEVIRWPERYF